MDVPTLSLGTVFISLGCMSGSVVNILGVWGNPAAQAGKPGPKPIHLLAFSCVPPSLLAAPHPWLCPGPWGLRTELPGIPDHLGTAATQGPGCAVQQSPPRAWICSPGSRRGTHRHGPAGWADGCCVHGGQQGCQAPDRSVQSVSSIQWGQKQQIPQGQVLGDGRRWGTYRGPA